MATLVWPRHARYTGLFYPSPAPRRYRQVNLRTKGSSSETGNVFITDGSEEISVYWASAEELVVVATGRIFKHEETFEGTRITVKK